MIAWKPRRFSPRYRRFSASEGFEGAIEVTLQSMLQSPQFLYRDEQALAAVPVPVVTTADSSMAD